MLFCDFLYYHKLRFFWKLHSLILIKSLRKYECFLLQNVFRLDVLPYSYHKKPNYVSNEQMTSQFFSFNLLYADFFTVV